MSFPLAAGVEGSADVSFDGVYRYDLVRRFPDELLNENGARPLRPLCLWVMLNPSTADANLDDPTLLKCQGFARRWGFRGIVVVNLFAFRSADPRLLARCEDPVGPDNDRVLARWAVDPQVGRVVAAWGAHPMAASRAGAVHKLMAELGPVWRLAATKGGAPQHPLYARYDVPPEWVDSPPA